MGKIIYIVTSGEYSDYGIDAIFSTKELAQKFVDSFNSERWDKLDIEEWDLDPNSQHLKQNRKPFFLRIDKSGQVTEIESASSTFGFRNEMKEPSISYTKNLELMNIYCFADDEKHAVKIASEKRSQILAANLWGIR